MIHKIKGLHDDGCGLSIRAISQELGISRNTVRKYLRADEVAIATAQLDRSREKRLDEHRDYIVHLLGAFPKLSAVKVARKLREKLGELEVSDRSIRRYVQMLKRTHAVGQRRYYEPVIDHLPGVQCQIDPGELRGVLIGGEARTVYFVAFVLSFSRLMYVGVSFTPIDTAGFIQLHDEAFRYFGGVPEECVYDQTKMVVIQERFRELTVNQRFHEYATAAGFRVHACEGYDPESKGKVEAAVKYVKQDCLYGETFIDHRVCVATSWTGWRPSPTPASTAPPMKCRGHALRPRSASTCAPTSRPPASIARLRPARSAGPTRPGWSAGGPISTRCRCRISAPRWAYARPPGSC